MSESTTEQHASAAVVSETALTANPLRMPLDYRPTPVRVDVQSTMPVNEDAVLAGDSGYFFGGLMKKAGGAPDKAILAPEIAMLSCAGGIKDPVIQISSDDNGNLTVTLLEDDAQPGYYAGSQHTGHSETPRPDDGWRHQTDAAQPSWARQFHDWLL